MFNALRVKPFKPTSEEAARAIEEQKVALDELVEGGGMTRETAERRKKDLEESLGNIKESVRDTINEEPIADEKACATEEELEYVRFVSKTFDELKELFIAKNSQYGSCEPLENLKLGAILGGAGAFPKSYSEATPCEWLWWARMWEEISGYERKHIVHVAMHGATGDKVDESLKDIAVYSVIKLYIYKKLCEALDKEKEEMEAGR